MNRPGAIIGASVLLVALAAAAIIVLDVPALVADRAASSPAESNPPSRQQPDPAAIYWAWADPAPFDDEHPITTEYLLQAGTLEGDGLPLVRLEVPWALAPDDVGRVPPVSAPAAGVVLFVSDDGRSSTVQRLRIADGAQPEELATLPEAVFAIELGPGGGPAYLAIVGRDGQDAGVIELSVDGSGERRHVLPPAQVGLDGEAVAPVALVRLSVQLRVSLDGRHLLRTACGGGGCSSHVVDLRAGDIVDAGDGPFLGILDGVFYRHECDLPPCTVVAMDIGSGRELGAIEVPDLVWLAAVDGRGVIVVSDIPERLDAASTLSVIPVDTGARRVVGRLGDGEHIDELLGGPSNGFRITPPDGVVVLSRSDRRTTLPNLAIDLVSGEAIEVRGPTIVAPLAPGVNG